MGLMIILLVVSVIIYGWLVEWESEHAEDENWPTHPDCRTCLHYEGCKYGNKFSPKCKEYEKRF